MRRNGPFVCLIMVATMPNMSSPFFSILVPTYNRALTLDRALTSVLRQTEQDWELLVIEMARLTALGPRCASGLAAISESAAGATRTAVSRVAATE